MLTSVKSHIDVIYGNHIVHLRLVHCHKRETQVHPPRDVAYQFAGFESGEPFADQ